jgi:hypothetical protein
MAAIPEASVEQATPGLKAVALSKLRCQLEELQQHNADLAADNDRLKDKNAAMQQVWHVCVSLKTSADRQAHTGSTRSATGPMGICCCGPAAGL